MTRGVLVHITSAALLGLSLASGVAAQAPKPEQTITIVGCLVQGNFAAAGGERRSESGAANANDYFVRTPAIAVPVGSTVTVGKPGAIGSGTSTSAGTPTDTALYRITGLDWEKLRPHVGHRVELQGHLTGNMENTSTAKTTVDAAGRATTRVETRMGVAGALRATSIKMVSESCP